MTTGYDPDRDLAADERLCERITPTPIRGSEVRVILVHGGREEDVTVPSMQAWWELARTALPDALARLRALREGPPGALLGFYLDAWRRGNRVRKTPIPGDGQHLVAEIRDIARALGVRDVEKWLRGE